MNTLAIVVMHWNTSGNIDVANVKPSANVNTSASVLVDSKKSAKPHLGVINTYGRL